MTMEVRLMLHDARVTRPEESGDYLVCRLYQTIRPLWMQVHYSKVHDLFNAQDYSSAEEAARTGFNADYWCENPLNDMRKDAQQEDCETFAGDMAKVLTEVADGDAVAHMRRYSIDAPEEPDYGAYPVGE